MKCDFCGKSMDVKDEIFYGQDAGVQFCSRQCGNSYDKKEAKAESGKTVTKDNSIRAKCKNCGKESKAFFFNLGYEYCSACKDQKQKHEKIEKMAFKFYNTHLLDTDKEPGITLSEAFECAEEFYNYAKEKGGNKDA